MNLDKYIAELLLEHDFVIVPDFGAFVSSYFPSQINSETDTISPPSKRVAFNPSLTLNDAMLVHFVSKVEKISYQQATDLIKSVVIKWKEELASGEIIRLNKIGELKQDNQGKLNFTQYNSFNFLIDSFGFGNIRIKPLLRRSFIPEFENNHESGIHEQSSSQIVRKKNSKILVYSLAAYLPLLIGLWIVFIVKEPFINYDQSSLNPISFREKEVNMEVVTKPKQTNLPVQTDTKPTEKIIIEQPKTESPKIKPDFYYYIIGGCFQDENNAQTFQNQLKLKDFNESEILGLKGGYYRVSYCKFIDENGANNFLTTIKEKENSLAWILKQ